MLYQRQRVKILELYSYEPALCKIRFETLNNGKIIQGFGTGFFCEINDINILFKKALFTNNHILDENSIKVNKKIKKEKYLQINNLIIHLLKS